MEEKKHPFLKQQLNKDQEELASMLFLLLNWYIAKIFSENNLDLALIFQMILSQHESQIFG